VKGVRDRIGRRGLLLSLLGILYILYGLGNEIGDSYWIYVGAVALIASAFRPRWVAVDEVAYGLLIAPPLFLSLNFLVSWVQYNDPDSYRKFIINSTLVALVLYCARNMTDRVRDD
jgi:hypothetical protein